ncbi:MAG: phage scaffolding protein [Bacillota bacterium]|nr:phage scaffolding protein [Bacillota bacterium]
MSNLEEVLGADLWQAVTEALAGRGSDGRNLELAVTNDGSFIPKAKFDALNKECQGVKEELARVMEERAGLEEAVEEREALTQALAGAKEELAALAADKETALLAVEREHYLERSLTAAGARNLKAVRALLDEEALVWNEGQLQGIDEQLQILKAEVPYLFQGVEGGYSPRAARSPADYSQMSDAEYYRMINRKG